VFLRHITLWTPALFFNHPMSLFWVKSWKNDLLSSLNFQQLNAGQKGFYSLLRDYVRDDEWCGGLCYPNGNPIMPRNFAKIIKGKPYLVAQYFDSLKEVGMVYTDKNGILCLRKYATKVIMKEAKCEKCASYLQGDCNKIGDNPDLPLQLPCHNIPATPAQPCHDNSATLPQGCDNLATTPPQLPPQPIDNKQPLADKNGHIEEDREADKELEKENPLAYREHLAMDLAQEHRKFCTVGQMTWAKDVFFSALNAGLEFKVIMKAIKNNPGIVANEIIKAIRKPGVKTDCPKCHGEGEYDGGPHRGQVICECRRGLL
jgi:hypothetical protein